MENGTNNQDDLLDDLSKKTALDLLPLSISMAALMVTGLCGNIYVCQFYRSQTKSTPIAKLIITLSIIDAFNCAFIPKHIVDMCFSYKYAFKVLCKTDAFLTHIFGLSSAFTVVTIAIFRYRMVCRPLLKQFTFREANVTIALAVFAAFCFSTPTLFASDVIPLEMTTQTDVVVLGHDCNKDPTKDNEMYLMINCIHVLLFVVGTTILLTLYGRMGRKIWSYSHKRNQMRGAAHRVNSIRTKSRYISSFGGRKYNINANEFYVWVDLPTQDSLGSGIDSPGQGQWTIRKRKDATNMVAARQTFMLFTISLILLIGYLPYTAMSVYTTLAKTWFKKDILSQVCLRSIVLGSALNPCVYGLFNADFRTYVRKTICCWTK